MCCIKILCLQDLTMLSGASEGPYSLGVTTNNVGTGSVTESSIASLKFYLKVGFCTATRASCILLCNEKLFFN